MRQFFSQTPVCATRRITKDTACVKCSVLWSCVWCFCVWSTSGRFRVLWLLCSDILSLLVPFDLVQFVEDLSHTLCENLQMEAGLGEGCEWALDHWIWLRSECMRFWSGCTSCIWVLRWIHHLQMTILPIPITSTIRLVESQIHQNVDSSQTLNCEC